MLDYDLLFKFILVGDSSVGKSCLMLQFTEGKYHLNIDPTIGVEFGSKKVKIGGKKVKLEIWDTAGQEGFKALTRSYFRSAIGAIIVFDLCNLESFHNVNT